MAETIILPHQLAIELRDDAESVSLVQNDGEPTYIQHRVTIMRQNLPAVIAALQAAFDAGPDQ